jgi:predicted dehydrogenase
MNGVALIGLGAMGERHVAALHRAGHPATAVCDVRADRATVAPKARFFTDASDMLAAERPELVGIATTANSHLSLTRLAIDHGARRILCEKPLATSVSDADEIVRLCQEAGTHLVINHPRRWHPGWRALHTHLETHRDVMGAVCHFSAVGGCAGLSNIGSHFLDLAEFLAGRPITEVSARLDRTGTPNPRGPAFHDPGGLVTFTCSGAPEVRGVLELNEQSATFPVVTILTEYGRIVVDELEHRWEIHARRASDRSAPKSRYGLPLERVKFDPGERVDIVDLTARSYRILVEQDDLDFEQPLGAKRALEVVVAAHRSDARGGAPVPREAESPDRSKSYAFA